MTVDWADVPRCDSLKRNMFRIRQDKQTQQIQREVRKETLIATSIGCMIGVLLAMIAWVIL